MTKRWGWISTPRYTIRVDINNDGYIINPAPIARWMKGKLFMLVIMKLQKQFGSSCKYKEFK